MDHSGAVRPLLRVRQVREFTDEPVDAAALEAIAQAARWSGSRENRQPWRFVLVRRPEHLQALAEAGGPDTAALARAAAVVAIVLPQEQGAAISNAFDEGRAAERMLVAATMLGLGAGLWWIGPDARPVVGNLLSVPDGHFVRTVVAVGHASDGSGRGRTRLPRAETVFSERFGEG